MTLVGEATVIVKYDSSAAAAALEADNEAALAGLGDSAAVAGTTAGEELRQGIAEGSAGIETDLADTGALAGANLRQGVKEASAGVERDLSETGSLAGAGLQAGIKDGTAGLANDLGDVGMLAGTGMRDGVREGTVGIADDLAKAADDGGKALEEGLGGSKLSFIGSALSGLGFPMGEVTEKAEKMGSAAEKGGLSLEHMASNAGVSKDAFLLGAGGIVALTGATVDLALHAQEASTKVANAAQISQEAAGKITDAFTNMAGTSENDGAALATAYATVAGQLGSVQGHALSAAEAVQVMTAAQNLAEATGTDLGSATSTLGSVMQAYQAPVKDATRVTDELYVAGERTGLGVDGLGAALVKVRSGLGAMAPPLSQSNALLVDMADHGETGRKGLSLLTTAFTTLVKPASDMAKAQDALKVSTDALPPSLKTLAAQYDAGQISGTQLTKVTDAMTGSQSTAWAAFIKASTGMTTAKQAADALGFSTVNAQGKFIGMGPVLGHLQDQIRGMSNEQATAKLTADGFGSSAAKMLAIVQAGPAAFDKATDAVTRHGAAAAAAAKQQEDMGAKAKILETDVEDLGEALGAVLLPALGDIAGAGVDVAKFLEATPPLAYALGAAVGIGLGIPVARFAANTAKDFIGSLVSMGEGTINLGAKMVGLDPVFAATQTAEQQTATALGTAAASMSASAERISAALTGAGAAAGEMAAEVETGTAAAVSAVTAADATIEAENEAAGLSFADLIPGAGIAVAVGVLATQFLHLGTSETTEAQAARQLTAAKTAETTAVQAGSNATLAAGNAYFAVKSAQQQAATGQEAVNAAIKKYGADSAEARTAIEAERQNKFQLIAANTQLTQSQADATDKLKEATDASTKQVTADQAAIDYDRQMVGLFGDKSKWESQLQQNELSLAAATTTRAQASATAAAQDLNETRNQQGLQSITGQTATKVKALSDIYAQMPKDVQTKLAADNTDALAKISALVTQLQQQGVGTPTIVKILGDSSNAGQAITNLTTELDSLPVKFREVGQEAGQGLVTGLDSQQANVAAAARSLSNAATVSARVTLRSHSPSQVFHDIGTDVGAGLAQGIDDSNAKVRDSITNLVTVDGKTYKLPTDLANTPTTPALEAAGSASTARDARHAASPAMVAAEQAWLTGAQAVVTNFTNAAQFMATKVSADSSKVSAQHTKASTDTSAAAQDARTAAAATRSAATDAKDAAKDTTEAALHTKLAAATGVSAVTKATDLSEAAQEKSAARLAEGGEAHEKAAAVVAEGGEAHQKAAGRIVTAAEDLDKAAQKTAASSEAKDKSLEATAAKGQSSLNTMLSAITSGNQQTLTTAMSSITERQMAAMVGKLDATHNKALEGMAARIETTWKQGMDALALANKIAANTATGTAITDAAASAAKLIADQQAVTDDSTVGASSQQTQLDQDTLSSDTTIGGDQARLDKAAPGSLAESQDQLQLAKDTAAQTVLLAKDNAALAALTAAQTAAAAATTAATAATTATATASAAAPAPATYVFHLDGSGQTTTADWINEIGIAMTIGTLPSAVPNASLPGNAALVVA
jgi:hypothetical protein